ncbi:MAG: tyrosine-type recombinase/integrase [Blautia faecis]
MCSKERDSIVGGSKNGFLPYKKKSKFRDAHTPHSFRHTFAIHGFEKGIPPKVMQEILGHKSITMVLDILCASRQRNPA